MTLIIASRRSSQEKLQQYYGNEALILDVTSQGADPWVRFSPFYPHGGIPVPFMPGETSASVEGIWQGLKVFETADIDRSKFAITRMKNIKRSARKYGRVLGHRAGDQLLPYVEARRTIYLPAYHWVLEHRLQDLTAELGKLSEESVVILLDYETNCDIADVRRPLSHAGLVKYYVEGNWPS